MMRLFFAVTLSEAAREAASRAQAHLRAVAGETGIKWEAPANFHYTLKFLGDVSEEQATQAMECARAVAMQFAPFTLALSQVGAFPEKRRPQVLWIGAAKDVPVLTRLAECLDRGLVEQGFAPETRRYRPHLTLARIKTPDGQEAVARTLATEAIVLNKVDKMEVFSVADFVLMRSELRPSGAVYSVLETFTFSAL